MITAPLIASLLAVFVISAPVAAVDTDPKALVQALQHNLETGKNGEFATGTQTCQTSNQSLKFESESFVAAASERLTMHFDDGMVLSAEWEQGGEPVLTYRNPQDDSLMEREDQFVVTPGSTAIGCRPSSVQVRDALPQLSQYTTWQKGDEPGQIIGTSGDHAPYSRVVLNTTTVADRTVLTSAKGFQGERLVKKITYADYVRLPTGTIRPTSLVFVTYRGKREQNPTTLRIDWEDAEVVRSSPKPSS